MEECRPSSPEPYHIQKTSHEKTPCQTSPTTVIETEDLFLTNAIPTDASAIRNDEIPSLCFREKLYSKFLNEQPSTSLISTEERYAKLRKRQRERKKYLNILPTIQEVSEEEEKVGERKTLGAAFLAEQDDISLHIQTLPPLASSDNEFKEIQLLIHAASQRAAKGNEQKALAIYKDGLSILKQEVARITEQIETLARRRPKFEKTALFIILHEEWAESALVIAEVRMMMANIYERHEDYDAALVCCEEARLIYQQQAVFDRRHHKKGSNISEKQMSVENLMEQIEDAKESHVIRQSLHETVERIHQKILATSDETSKGFLFEDIFDKLSTVLSLEVMYLGETHPQIANTKGLLSIIYSEIGQHEKALRAINDGILICETTLGDSHPQTGIKYHEAAKLYERIGDEDSYSKSIDLYEKAISTLEKAEGNVSERLCSSLNSVAVRYIKHNSYDLAIKKLERAIHISEENYRERSDDMSTEPIQLWLNLGECRTLKGETALGTEAVRNALRIQKDKRKVHDETRKGVGRIPDLISNTKIAFTMKRLAKNLALELKYEQSYEYFIEVLSILQAYLNAANGLAKFDATIDLPRREDEVASVLYDLAKVKHVDMKYIEAAKFYRESLELRKATDKLRAPNERSNHMDCAMCLAGIGIIQLIQKEDSEAFKSFNQAIYYAKQEGISDSHPVTMMLWEKSRIAAGKMNQEQNPIEFDQLEERETIFKSEQTSPEIETKNEDDDAVILRLEEEAKELREAKEYEMSIKTLNIVINLKRTLLKKSKGGEESTNAKRQLAASLISKGEVALLKNSRNEATECVEEASNLLKRSGVNENDHSFRKIVKVHDTVKKIKRRKRMSDTIRKMKGRRDSTAEF
eukprot:CAMPEP_0197180250 /NCGR_PEP_ID=MMETSP1423-20130617/4919_1 /TAXON_ID=476441 /ORGANISM="Pseudo-nitzschia heimii, Strain UNC1101" /LENGTH=867 /DNA_ID=CAMNT_0042630293 /DNA_START=176 /DNA_END=2779 /DNA_ORIENTATION=+